MAHRFVALKVFSLLCFFCSFVSVERAQAQTTAPNLPGYTLTYDEEFNEPVLDPTKWLARGTGAISIGADLEAFLPTNVQMLQPSQGENGVAFNVQAPIGGYNATTTKNFAYTSGYINGYGIHQKYGYWTAHLQLPNTGVGNGTWPAWWLMPVDGSWNYEIDIMEQFNITDWGTPDPSHVYGHLHWGWGAHSATICASAADPDNWTGFHDYAVDWEPNGGTTYPSVTVPYLAIYIDGVLCTGPDNPTGIYTGGGIPNLPMYPLLEDNVGNAPQNPDLTKPFIAKSVSLYKRNDVAAYVEPLRMGIVTTDKTSYKPGDTVIFSATAYTGNAAASSVGGSIGVFDLCGDNGSQGNNECSPANGNSIFGNWNYNYPAPNIAANSSAQIQWSYVLPTTIPTGYMYNYYGSVGGTIGGSFVGTMAQYVPFLVEAPSLAGCGSTPSGSTVTNTLSTTTGTIPATGGQCPYGGTQATTTTTSQIFLCTNGTLAAQGSPNVTTVNTGNPVCTAGASCGATASGATVTNVIGTSSGSIPATFNQCPYGGTQATSSTISQTYLCTNGTLAVQGSPTTVTINVGNPVCAGAAACGATPSGSTVTNVLSQVTGSIPATSNQCPLGGTQPTTTTTSQTYLCTNGSLTAQGVPSVSTVDTGNPICSSAKACGSTLSGSTVTKVISQKAGSVATNANQCPFAGKQPIETTTTQTYLCSNGTLTKDGAPVVSSVDSGAPMCNATSTSATPKITEAVSEIKVISANINAAVATHSLTLPSEWTDITTQLTAQSIIPAYMVPGANTANGPWPNQVFVMASNGNAYTIYYVNAITASGCRGILSPFVGPSAPSHPTLSYVTPSGWANATGTTPQKVQSEVPATCIGVSLSLTVP